MRKQLLRQQIRAQRVNLEDRELRSEQIQRTAWNLLQIQSARSVMVYVSYRSEVQTGSLISHLLEAGKTVVVPWCSAEELNLFRLESLEELRPGAYGIPEPSHELKQDSDRIGRAEELDVVLVPGIAFDRAGHRLGQGRGYYDRLLDEVRDECVLIGLAFDIQIVEEVPVEAHDVALNLIVTESEIIPGTQSIKSPASRRGS